MDASFVRRHFLRMGTALAAASAVGVPATSHAEEPVKRNGTAKFKFSLAAYSYRNLLTGKQPTLSLLDFVSDCAKFQLDGTELTSYCFPNPVTPVYLRELKAHCFRL